MALRQGIVALCCGLLGLTWSGPTAARADDDKPAAEKKVKASEDAGKAHAEKDAKGDARPDDGKNGDGKNGNGKNGNGKNGNGHHAATVQTRPTARGEQGHIKVHLPVPEARLWVDETLTRASGVERLFRSPVRDKERTYAYQLKAEWTDADGRVVQRKARVSFRGQEDVIIDFR